MSTQVQLSKFEQEAVDKRGIKFLNLLIAVKKFEELQTKYREFGATDSEPNHWFEYLLKFSCEEHAIKISTARDWQLFSSMKGWKAVAKKLTTESIKVQKQMLKADKKDVDGYWFHL